LIEEGLPIEKKNEIVSAILPVYSEFVSDLWDWTLSEFKFINYIESIMETFRLTYNNQVWIQNVTLVEWYSVGILDSTLETNIYYIPVTFDLVWRRADILDFLYFAERVWKVTIDGNDIEIDNEVSADFKSSFTKGRLLVGQANGTSIFANQIFDIETVSFPEYIDPDISYSERYKNALSLASYIKGTNFSWDYKVTVKLRFYVKGLPIYKVQKYIKEFIWVFSQLENSINVALNNTSITSSERSKLTDLQTALAQFRKTILPNIEQWLQLKNINEWYSLVNRYYPTLKEYKATVDSIISNLK
jgi:hypothetical protein